MKMRGNASGRLESSATQTWVRTSITFYARWSCVSRPTEAKCESCTGFSAKPTYIIDCDFFTEKQTETKVVGNVLDAFNRRAGHLFRWHITQRLHAAMDPRDPSPP